MRRNDREITEFSEMTDVMKRCDVCRLALNDEEGYPYLLPLNFGMEETDGRVTLYFHGAKEGKKYDLIRKDARASFEMDCSHRLVLPCGRMAEGRKLLVLHDRRRSEAYRMGTYRREILLYG